MGGGAMKNIGRVMGLASGGGMRGTSFVPIAEQAVWKSGGRPVAAGVLTGEDAEAGTVLVSNKVKVDATASRRSAWEIDDWEFAGSEVDYDCQPESPQFPARLVFGPGMEVISREEAEITTEELKETLEKVYFSSGDGATASHIVQNPSSSDMSSSQMTNSFSSDRSLVFPSDQNNSVLSAFSLMRDNPAVQNMVLSLATDRHLWNAVMNNEKVVEFCQSHQTDALANDAAETVKICEYLEDANGDGSLDKGKDLWDVLDDMKLKVTEFLGKLQEFTVNLFDVGPKDNPAGGDAKNDFVGTTVKASVILAVIVMVVSVLKRV